MEKFKAYFKFIPWAIILILIIILSVSTCSRQKIKLDNNEAELKEQIKTEQAKIAEISAKESVLKMRIYNDSIASNLAKNEYVKKISALKRELGRARKPVQALIDSIPALDNFVDIQDSTINLQDNRIDTLEYEKAEMWAKFNALLSASEEKNKVQIELNSHYQDLNKQLDKQVRRERNKKTFWKVTTGILGGALVAKSIGVF